MSLEMCPAKSPFAEQETKDKRMIDKGIIEAKKSIGSKDFAGALKIINSISPASRRLNYHQFELTMLNSILFVKQEKWQEAKSLVQSSTRMKPDEPLPWKLLIQVEDEIGTNESLKTTLIRALDTSRPDGSLLSSVAPYLKKFDDESLTSNFIRLINIIPNGLDLPVATFIPENPKTVEIRTKMLERASNNDQKSCSDLIHILLDEDDPFKALKYAKMLPVDHIDRIYVETLIGDDPVGSARKHVELGSNRFRDFLIAADSHNLAQVRTEVNLIPPFVSGWIYLAKQEKDPKNRIQILTDATNKFPNNLTLMQILAESKEETGDVDGAINVIKNIKKNDHKLGSELLIKVLIRQKRCQEAANLLQTDKDLVVNDAEKATIEFELYKIDNNVQRLKTIIDFPESPDLAGLKAEAAWGLRSELGDECERLFAAALRCDRNNGRAYLMFGKWMLEYKHDEEKAVFLLIKSAELGCVDSDSTEIVTRKYISENRLKEALELLKKVDTNWSHFRAALIHQRLEEHESAAQEFQLDLRFNPNRLISWQALGHSYLILGRAMAAQSVAEQLREMGSPDLTLEFEINNIFGKPIDPFTNFNLDSTPQPFYAYLEQTIETIRRFKRLGRKESAMEICKLTSERVKFFSEKWSSLATVLKICGDFYVESFSLTNSNNDANDSILCYKKRCEIDRRAESFIDLAHSLQLNGQLEQSIVVLRKVVKTFPEHAGLWMNLGIAFALSNKFPFARHCLCISAKLATDMEQARSLACCANVALLINDQNLLHSAIEAARRANPCDPDVWQMLAATTEKQNIEASLIAFRFGASDIVVKSLPELCLRANKPMEALGFSLLLGDDSLISISFEAIGRYDFALLYEKDSERRKLLECLAGKSQSKLQSSEECLSFPNLEIYRNGRFEEAANLFDLKNDTFSKLAAAICYAKSGNVEKALQIFNEQKSSIYSSQIQKLMLQVLPDIEPTTTKESSKATNKETPNESTKQRTDYEDWSIIQKDPETYFLDQLRKNSRVEAAKNLIKRFPSDQKAMYIFVVESLKSKVGDCVDDMVITKARGLYSLMPNSQTLALLTSCQIKLGFWKEAIQNLQILCILRPNIARNAKQLIDSIRSKL